jgi:hypothetical protein
VEVVEDILGKGRRTDFQLLSLALSNLHRPSCGQAGEGEGRQNA